MDVIFMKILREHERFRGTRISLSKEHFILFTKSVNVTKHFTQNHNYQL
jgi:ribosomal protein S15P/S13E